MIELRRRNERCLGMLMVIICLMCQNSNLCWSLNDEGLGLLSSREILASDPFGALWNWKDGVFDPCSWFGLKCSDGNVVYLNIIQTGAAAHRKMLQDTVGDPWTHLRNHLPQLPSVDAASPSPSPSPSFSPSVSPALINVPTPALTSPFHTASASPPPVMKSPSELAKGSRKNNRLVLKLSVAVGCSVLLIILLIGLFCHSGNKGATVTPWATKLSGQLQKAFVTGVPKINRSELETACEDFSNVVGSSSIGTVYKGTMSNGVEIAVISVAPKSAKDWSKDLETHFRNKIETLSKLNHKNFVNLLGYCVEEEPFTRMMIFEYAPNGTLFEHLHVKEAERLDWGMRMRIAMGIAYCLDHMYQLKPPMTHKNLNSTAVYLTEDYASKISDFGIWDEELAAASDEMESHPASNIFSFGVLLFEMITCRVLYSVDSCSFEECAFDFLRAGKPLAEMMDPVLVSFPAEQLEKIGDLIRYCVHPDWNQRPSMSEISARLRGITGIGPDEAIPKLSSLWWAELEILPTEAASSNR